MSILHYKGCDQSQNENWRGPDEDENLLHQPIKNIYTPCECKLLCQENSDCEYWTYKRTSKRCWLKKNFKYKATDHTFTSGWPGTFYHLIFIRT